jgi:metallo-beta-lactamase class B
LTLLARSFAILFIVLAAIAAQLHSAEPSWTRPFPPFRIAGNLYYVGSEELAAFLVVTPRGLILINSNLVSSPPQIRDSVEALGFPFSDIKILLISHAHSDHAAGSAEILRMTHAKYAVMEGDVAAIESGGRSDFAFGANKSMWYPPAHVDRMLHDGDTVALGGSVLTAHKTAGHTMGTTTWTMDVDDSGRRLHVVIVGSPSVLSSYRLLGNRAYPQIASDYRHEFEVLKALPCEIFLGSHASFFHLKEKYARFKAGGRGAFIDPVGYRNFVAEYEQDFEAALARQTTQPPGP